ncbi:hypothetical protein Tco_1028370 [Tanacetum coccineum]|uniref:Uncharacterized protein n=1 Tax=Tanacetum coccineum TaxID=301880 RepID=A0ABQ5G0G5_9ASTR
MSSSSKSSRDYSRKYQRVILEPWRQSHGLPPSPPSPPPTRTTPTSPISNNSFSYSSPLQNSSQNLNEIHHLSNLLDINLQQAIEATNPSPPTSPYIPPPSLDQVTLIVRLSNLYSLQWLLANTFSEQVGLAGDLGSTSDVLIPWVKIWTSGLLVYKESLSRIVSRFLPRQLYYPERKLSMEYMLNKFINEGKREQEEMDTFIREFMITNELLLKEQNNLLSELKIGVHELSKVMSDVLVSRHEIKGVTTRGGKITEVTYNKEINETNLSGNEPPRFQSNEQDRPEEVMVDKEPPNILEKSTKPAIKPQQPPVPFPNWLRKEKRRSTTTKILRDPEATPHKHPVHRRFNTNA